MLLQGRCTGVIEDKHGQIQGYSIILDKNNKQVNLTKGFIRKGIREGKINISNIIMNPDGEIIVDIDDGKLQYVCIDINIIQIALSMMKGNEKILRFKRHTNISGIVNEYKELKLRGRAYYSVNLLNKDLCIIRQQCFSTIEILNKPKEEVQKICNELASQGKAIYTITGRDIYYINGSSEIFIVSSKPMYLQDDTNAGLFNGLSIEAIDFKNIIFEKSKVTKSSFNNTHISKVLNFNKT